LHDFQSRYEQATVIELTQNYRSTRQIVNFANRLRSASGNQSDLTAVGPVGLAPRIMKFDTATHEAAYLASQVKAAIASGTKPSQIAILYRINGQSEVLENALAQAGVEYQLRGGVRFFARPEIVQAMQTIRAELVSGTSKATTHLVTEIARGLGWSVEAPSATGAARDKWESLNALLGILDEVPADTSLEDFYNELAERQRSQHDPVRAAAVLTTIHAAKGLEWDHVFISGLSEGYLPISYAKTEPEIAEELRLLYVAITRAKRQLLLTWAETDHQPGKQQGRSSGASFTRQPSRFLDLLEPKH
jgi:DNA helicase-2/ATP-dependent DNA helicase PcrA